MVTSSTSKSWNSFHAAVYHDVVHPSGSHVPSQRLAKELVATAAIMRPMLTTKIVINPSRKPRQALSSQTFIERSSSFAARHRAAIEEVAKRQHRGDDDELHEAHDHRDRGGERVVVL